MGRLHRRRRVKKHKEEGHARIEAESRVMQHQRAPNDTHSHQGWHRRGAVPPNLQGAVLPTASFPTSRLPNWEKTNSIVLSHLHFGHLLQQPEETNTWGKAGG